MAEKKDVSKLNFEDALKKLEGIVRKLESGDAGLEESITIYEEGMVLKNLCEEKLTNAQLKVQKITLNKDGKTKIQKFE